MADYLHDDILDTALAYIETSTENLYITSSVATTFTEASATYALGAKASPGFTGPADGTSGRKITIDAITDGTVTGTGTAAFWALTDDSATKLLAAGPLAGGVAVVSGGTFTVADATVSVTIPDVA